MTFHSKEKVIFYYVLLTENSTLIYLILVMLIAGLIGCLILLSFRRKNLTQMHIENLLFVFC